MSSRGQGHGLTFFFAAGVWLLTTGELAQGASSPVVRVHVNGQPVCTGVFVTRRQVLTAKHCLRTETAERVAPSQVSVMRIGDFQAMPIHGIDGATGQGAAGDLAILLLEEETDVVPAALPPSSASLPIGAWSELRRVTFDRPTPANRQALSVRVLARDPGVLYTTPASCDGDSGAPLFSSTGTLVGVASSRAFGACGEGPSIFTELGPHLPWIGFVAVTGFPSSGRPSEGREARPKAREGLPGSREARTNVRECLNRDTQGAAQCTE